MTALAYVLIVAGIPAACLALAAGLRGLRAAARDRRTLADWPDR